MTLLRTFITLLLSFSAIAVIDCQHDRSELIESEFFLSQNPVNSKINCELVSKIHNLSFEVAQTYSTFPKVSLFLEQKGFAASYDQARIIKLPQQFFRRNNNMDYHIQEGDKILPIFVHEYGHAIFTELLRAEFPEYEELSDKIEKISEIQISVKSLQERIKEKNISVKERKSARDKIHRHSLEIGKIKKELQSGPIAQKLKTIVIPYHELFADIIAVYFYNDKEIMREAVNHPKYDSNEKKVPQRRSFEDSITSTNDLDHKDVHGYFSPIRKLIGDKYWPKDQDQKDEYIKIIFKAMANDIRRRVQLENEESYIQNIEGLKNSIINEFKNSN